MSLFQFAALACLAGAALALIMLAAWIVQRRTGVTGWIDVTWSFGVGLVGAAGALWPIGGATVTWRQIVVAILVGVWSLRLATHIAGRSRAQADDPRYRQLIREWGPHASRRMFWFLQAQAAIGTVLAIAVSTAAHHPGGSLRVQDVVGVLMFVAALGGEALSDRQLRQFKSEPRNRNRICDIGLWRHSRHPNYFFEWLVWVSFAIIAVDLEAHSLVGWSALAAPVAMYWVLVYASGIPPLEEHMLRRHGDAFRAYQARTPAFFPSLRPGRA